MTNFDDVIHGWQIADPDAIHPLRAVNIDAYWESGRSQALEAAMWIPEGGTVLDFGCGEGRLSIPLAKLGYEVTAVDASPEMLARLLMYQTTPPVKSLVLSTGVNLHELVDPQDVVVARAVLIHHSHEDVAVLVSELAKVLKPGGHLIADWPIGGHYVRQNWTDVTTWEPENRLQVGNYAGLELVHDGTPTVWRKL